MEEEHITGRDREGGPSGRRAGVCMSRAERMVGYSCTDGKGPQGHPDKFGRSWYLSFK